MATVKELQAHPLEDVPTSSPGSDSPMSSSSTAPAASSSGGAVPRGLVRRLTATHPPAGADDSSATAAPGREGTYTPASETPRTSLVRTGVLSEIVEPGKRIFTDGVRGPGEMPPGGWPSLALGLLIATAYTGWIFIFFFMHVLALLGLFGLLLSGPATAALVTVNALLWATVLLPPPKPYNTWLLKHPMWRHLRTFFSFSIVVDEVPKHEQDGPFLYVHVPHAVFPVSQVVCATVAPHAFAGHKIYGGAADAVLRFPFYRQLLSALGLVPASEANLKQLLRGGNSVVLIPGGIAEMYVGKPDREVLVLSSRRGFARIAVEEGVKIIPVWHFGNSQLLRITAPRWLERLCRRYRCAAGIVGNPHCPVLPVPSRVPLMMAIGKAIPVKKVDPSDPGFAAAVEATHADVVDAVNELYNRHKHTYGWSKRPLEIV